MTAEYLMVVYSDVLRFEGMGVSTDGPKLNNPGL
jgi:hypothetical protein